MDINSKFVKGAKGLQDVTPRLKAQLHDVTEVQPTLKDIGIKRSGYMM